MEELTLKLEEIINDLTSVGADQIEDLDVIRSKVKLIYDKLMTVPIHETTGFVGHLDMINVYDLEQLFKD